MASARSSPQLVILFAELRATAGLRVTKARLARVPAAVAPALAPSTAPPPAQASPAQSTPLGSQADEATDDPDDSGEDDDAFGDRLMETWFDAATGVDELSDADDNHDAVRVNNDDAHEMNDADGCGEIAAANDCGDIAGVDDCGDNAAADDCSDEDDDRWTGEEVWHPYALPPAPPRHPANDQKNHFDPEAEWDYSIKVNVIQLHDMRGEAPHRCYLAEWDTKPLQLTWVWEENLGKIFDLQKAQVHEWKESMSRLSFKQYYAKEFANRDGASASGGCFMDAVRAVLVHLGAPELVAKAEEVWGHFERAHPKVVYGVSRGEAKAFFRALQHSDFPLDYDCLFSRALDGSYTNIHAFEKFARTLDEGAYIASVGEGLVGHCVVLLPQGAGVAVEILDGMDNPAPEPLTNLDYFDKAKWISRIRLKPGYRCRHGKRKPKSQKKREKRLKEAERQQPEM